MNVDELKSLLLAIAVGCLLASLQAAEPVQSKLDQALIAQIRRGAVEEVGILLDKGANPNAKGGLASALQYAASGNHLRIMQMLIGRDADVNAIVGDGTSPLVAAASNQTAGALKLLLDAGAKPTAAALSKACWLNRGEAVTMLLDSGVSPDAGTVSAAQGGHAKLLKGLLARGADVNAKSSDGNTALHAGALQGGVDVVRLLRDQGADPDATNDRGETPLHMAIKGDGHVEIVRMLLAARANPSLRNKELVSPIRLAAIQGHIPVYRLLLEASGGKEPVGINPKDSTADESKKTTQELIVDTSSPDYQMRKQATLALVARGGVIMPELQQALESQRENGALYEVLVKIGPEAATALPELAEMLPNKHQVVIARRTMDQIKPGHFAQLSAPVRAQADAAFYEAVIDPRLQEVARYFADWLSDESRLKLLRSQDAQHRALAVRILARPGQWSEQVEADLIRILLAKDEQLGIRENAALALGGSNALYDVEKALLQ